jgi:isopentenyl-diphosphate delta-isomerase type 1
MYAIIQMNPDTTDPQEELFDVVNENDEIVGEATRREVHQDPKLIHRVVHIWIINDKGEILLQQRSMKKDKAPGMWDISCGGHVRKGHEPEVTAERELEEELGIKADCKLIKKYVQGHAEQTEMVYLYCAQHSGPFTFNDGEVEQVKFFSKEDALKFIEADPLASYFAKQQIPWVFEYIKF